MRVRIHRPRVRSSSSSLSFKQDPPEGYGVRDPARVPLHTNCGVVQQPERRALTPEAAVRVRPPQEFLSTASSSAERATDNREAAGAAPARWTSLSLDGREVMHRSEAPASLERYQIQRSSPFCGAVADPSNAPALQAGPCGRESHRLHHCQSQMRRSSAGERRSLKPDGGGANPPGANFDQDPCRTTGVLDGHARLPTARGGRKTRVVHDSCPRSSAYQSAAFRRPRPPAKTRAGTPFRPRLPRGRSKKCAPLVRETMAVRTRPGDPFFQVMV